MKLINTNAVPIPILRALQDKRYKVDLEEHLEGLDPKIKKAVGDRTISTTTLARSPRQRILENRHYDEITLEPRDLWWQMLGKLVHTMLEEHAEPGDVIEQRVGRVFDVRGVGEVYVHGQADRITGPQSTEWYGPGKLNDWKWTKFRALSYDKSAYHMQVNVLAHLLNNNQAGPSIHVHAPYYDTYLLKDWDPKYYRGAEGDYPYDPWVTSQADTWSEVEVIQYIHQRAFVHFSSEDLADDDLPFCNDKELWRDPPLYKIFRLNPDGSRQKRIFSGSGVHHTRISANEWIKNFPQRLDAKKKPYSFEVQDIPSRPAFCAVCKVKSFCNQWRIENESQSTEEPEGEAEEMP